MKAILFFSALVFGSLAAEPFGRVLAPVESVPHLVNGLAFSVVTQAEWPKPGRGHSGEKVILQLRITNRTEKAMLFPTFDSFLPTLTTPDGEVVRLGGGRDATIITPHLLLPPGASYSLPLKATIRPQDDGKAVGLVIEDGTGTMVTATLRPGDFLISFSVFSTHYDFKKEGPLAAPLWEGRGATKPIGFTLKAN